MSIIFNYAHQDKAFVDQLINHLSLTHREVCMELSEFYENDELIERIKNSADGSKALIVIISKTSVGLGYGSGFLPANLMFELEKKDAVIIPVIIEDCDVPDFAQSMPVADFRTDICVGLDSILDGLDRLSNLEIAKNCVLPCHIEGARDCCNDDGKLFLLLSSFFLVQRYGYSCCSVHICGNSVATSVFRKNPDKIEAKLHVHRMLNAYLAARDMNTLGLVDESFDSGPFVIDGLSFGEKYVARIRVKILAESLRRDIPVDIPDLIDMLYREISASL